MCVAILKPIGAKMPTDSELRNCFRNNSDGAGIAYYDKTRKNVIIDKGYMREDRFIEIINRYNFDENDLVLIHCRTATHGGVAPQLTHPFPISTDEDQMRLLDNRVESALVHNGIISGTASKHRVSDTMAFIRDVIAKKQVYNHIYYSNGIRNKLEKEIGWSKMAFINNKGECCTVGNFVLHNDVYFSNRDYEYAYRYNISSNYNNVYGWSTGDRCKTKPHIVRETRGDKEYAFIWDEHLNDWKPFSETELTEDALFNKEDDRCAYCGVPFNLYEEKYYDPYDNKTIVCDMCYEEIVYSECAEECNEDLYKAREWSVYTVNLQHSYDLDIDAHNESIETGVCPYCNDYMADADDADVEAYYCSRCNLMFFDKEAIEREKKGLDYEKK